MSASLRWCALALVAVTSCKAPPPPAPVSATSSASAALAVKSPCERIRELQNYACEHTPHKHDRNNYLAGPDHRCGGDQLPPPPCIEIAGGAVGLILDDEAHGYTDPSATWQFAHAPASGELRISRPVESKAVRWSR